ncbi:SGNH/GDSL hydrolase family protein [Paracoccus sp. T5]|uniref:SGNH/GDSL hydrolase family protein n=1 Tax=Paracoccus sp. T5 TaxID=3402161 RepID=UPI003AE0BAB1
MARLLAAFVAVTMSLGPAVGLAELTPSSLPHLAGLSQPFLIEEAGNLPALQVETLDLSQIAGAAPLAATVVGRVAPLDPADPDAGPGAFGHQWPAVHATARFEGDALDMAFDDPVNRYRIQLDGPEGPVLQVVTPGRRAVRLSGLGAGPHGIRLEKVSESPSGAGRFLGFFLPEGGTPLAPPALHNRQIEFVGDSDTVGLGNLSPTRNCDGYDIFLETTDTQKSFGPQVARHFDADYQMIAASGIRLTPDAEGAVPAMLDLYPMTVPDDPEAGADAAWSPDLVVVQIGSNDLVTRRRLLGLWRTSELPPDFVDGYLRLLQDIRADHPGAHLLVVALAEYGDEFVAAHDAVFAARRAQGDTRIDLLSISGLERTACNWHPSAADHRLIAQAIIDLVETRPRIWN